MSSAARVLALGLALVGAAKPNCIYTDVYHGVTKEWKVDGCTSLALGRFAGGPDGGPQMQDMGAFQLARALAGAHQVTHVTLVNQGIGIAGAAELAETLKTHPSIVSLDLLENPITDAGTAVLAEALQTNVVLTSLLCHAEGEGAEAIVQAITCNSQFATLTDPETRRSEATRCKTRLGPYLAESSSQINRAVSAQANLETRLHQVETRPAAPIDTPHPAAAATHNAEHLPPPSPPHLPPEPPHSLPPSSPPAEPAPPHAAPHSPPPHPPSSSPPHSLPPPPPTPPPEPCEDQNVECASWSLHGECARNGVFMAIHCRKSCHLCGTTTHGGPSTPPLHTPTASTEKATQAASTVPHVPAGSPEAREPDLVDWIVKHDLDEKAHLPILHALGAHRVRGKLASLKPLRLLTYSEISTELHYAEEMKDLQLPCGHHCAADKAAVYAALKDDLELDPSH